MSGPVKYRLTVTFEIWPYGSNTDTTAINQTKALCSSESLTLVKLERETTTYQEIEVVLS